MAREAAGGGKTVVSRVECSAGPCRKLKAFDSRTCNLQQSILRTVNNVSALFFHS